RRTYSLWLRLQAARTRTDLQLGGPAPVWAAQAASSAHEGNPGASGALIVDAAAFGTRRSVVRHGTGRERADARPGVPGDHHDPDRAERPRRDPAAVVFFGGAARRFRGCRGGHRRRGAGQPGLLLCGTPLAGPK